MPSAHRLPTARVRAETPGRAVRARTVGGVRGRRPRSPPPPVCPALSADDLQCSHGRLRKDVHSQKRNFPVQKGGSRLTFCRVELRQPCADGENGKPGRPAPLCFGRAQAPHCPAGAEGVCDPACPCPTTLSMPGLGRVGTPASQHWGVRSSGLALPRGPDVLPVGSRCTGSPLTQE